jgi:hypothetical protein
MKVQNFRKVIIPLHNSWCRLVAWQLELNHRVTKRRKSNFKYCINIRSVYTKIPEGRREIAVF